ncbi:hypothetical protein SSTU70S_03435 [Stutzerimonas stutzeri]
MACWILLPAYTVLADDFASLDAVFALQGERLTSDPLSEVIRIERNGVRYYVKRYWGAGKGLRRFIGRPRVKAEWQNLKLFHRWGIPTAPIVAYGLERRAGLFLRGALIARELEQTEDLALLAKNHDARLKNPRWVREVSDKRSRATAVCSVHDIGPFGAQVVRREEEANLQALLADPDAFIAQGTLYKGGGTATVARVELDGRALLIKRYNIKGLLHWLKRFWRPSRAWHSWVEGNRLDFLGIATPRLLAVKERRWLWLRGKAWLITELLAGEDLIARWQPYLNSMPPEEELQALDRLFARLIGERISHGDLKGHNLFWENGRWTLIDLDAVQQHSSVAAFARAYARDRARLLRNWPSDSALYRLLDERLPRL